MNILLATDLLPKSEAALERAGFLADSLRADLTIVHAVAPLSPDGHPPEARMRRANSQLVARTSRPNWHWESQLEIRAEFGRPARVVLDNAIRQSARLLILGPHRNSVFVDAMKTSITEQLLVAATCPLLIARQEVRDSYRHVLLALDTSPNAADVVHMVESLGLAQEGVATVVHAHEPLYASTMTTFTVRPEAVDAYVDASRAQATAGIRELLETHSNQAHRYEIMIVERRPTTAILDAVESLEPDLVVLGTRGHGRLRRALLGSVATDVLRAARCDVLLVPERVAPTKRPLQDSSLSSKETRATMEMPDRYA